MQTNLSLNRRFSLGDRRRPGSGCVTAWFTFDPIFVGDSPLDMLQFVERRGKVGVRYPAGNLTAWKD